MATLRGIVGARQSPPDRDHPPLRGRYLRRLQFFKAVLKDRRLVQLGESGHGVAEFNHAKVRLIKFLHQQMGFDVIAFESGLSNVSPPMARRRLFRRSPPCATASSACGTPMKCCRYSSTSIHTGHGRPLRLAGFDTQISSGAGIATRPAFFRSVISVIDPARGERAQTSDQGFIQEYQAQRQIFAKNNEAALTAFLWRARAVLSGTSRSPEGPLRR